MTALFAGLSVFERNVVHYKRQPLILLSAVFEPFIFLFGLGVGLGQIVGDVEWHGELLSYPEFVAPALIATSAMNGALFEMSFNFYFKLKEAGTYDAMLATPLKLTDIVDGELTWAMMRGGIYSVVFVLALAVFGLLSSWWAILIPVVALLVGLAFASLASLATTWVRNWQDFDLFFLATQPLFVLSTTFFALDVYPSWAQPIVQATPLYHGIDLIRDLARGTVDISAIGHLVYLTATVVLMRSLAAKRLKTLLNA